MEAILTLNPIRFGYLLENSARYEGVPIYKHVVDCAFGFILGVIPNCTIDNKTKKALVRKQVKLLRSASGLKRPAGRRILVKRVILNSPFFAMKMGVRMVNRVL